MSALAASGSFSYAAALQLLDDVVTGVAHNGGLVSRAEFNDLQTIASNLNDTIQTSDYVVSLFTQLVDGSPANANWTGGAGSAAPLGNLQVGTTAAQLTELIGKWFLGSDLPDPTAQGATSSVTISPTYQSFTTLPLFAANGVPTVADINQGDVGDCELCAGMIEVVLNHPNDIESMITSDGNGIYGVRFYVGGKTLWITVNDQFPVYQGTQLFNQGPSLWADLVEKAYAQLSATGLIDQPAVNSYANINGDPAFEVMENLTNSTSVGYFFSTDPDWNQFKSVFIGAIAAKDDVVVESNGNTTDGANNKKLIADHAFAVVGYDSATGDFIVRNPWGVEPGASGYDTQFEISMADIVTVSGDVVIDNVSNPNILITTLGLMTTLGQSNSFGAFIADGQHVTIGTTIPVSGLFTATDVAGLPVTEYSLQSIGSGSLHLNGAADQASAAQQAAGQIVVSEADLAKLSFTAGSVAGGTDLLVSAFDGVAWSTPANIALTATTMPNAVAPTLGLVVAPYAHLSIAGLFKVNGAVDSTTVYDITVENNGGNIALNGATDLLANGGSSHVQVSAADLPDLTFVAPGVAPTSNFDQAFLDVTLYQGGSLVSDEAQIPILIGQSVAMALHSFNQNALQAWIAITDSAATVAASLDALQTMFAAADIQMIALTDSFIPSLTISTTQAVTDAGVLGAIVGDFSVVQEVSGNNLTIAGVAAALGNSVAFAGPAGSYSIKPSGDGVDFTVSDALGTDHLSAIQGLRFGDFTLIVAPTPGSGGLVTGGNVTELYGAVFSRVPDVAGLAYYENQLKADPGLTLLTLAEDFLQSPEYTAAHTYPQTTPGDAQFITDSYSNLLHRAPESGAIPYYQALIARFTTGLTAGTAAYQAAELQAHATLLVDFSASAEFLGDVQVTAAHPADASHWLILI